MSYQTDALFETGNNYSEIPPYAMNANAATFQDILLTGISGAAVNALNIASGAAPTVTQQIQVQQHSNLMSLLFLGGLLYLLVGAK